MSSNAKEARLSAAMIATLRRNVEDIAPELIRKRREFHARPEIGWREIETSKSIVAELGDIGFRVISGKEFLGEQERLGMSDDPISGEGETGCLAELSSATPGPTVCLRVDIDALPIEEAHGEHAPDIGGWRSRNKGAMHACGHDGHIAIGLGVAMVIKPFLDELPGRVKILFQPAEEGGRGARAVRDAGWVDDVDFLVAVHLGLGLPSRTLALGVHGFLATRKYRMTFTGRPAHAGVCPEDGRNALIGACQAVLGLHSLAQSSRPGIRMNVGTFKSGRSLNIVPDTAEFDFEMRAVCDEDLDKLEKRCLRLVRATAEAHELALDYTLRGEAASWSNSPEIANWAYELNQLVEAFPFVRRDFDFRAGEDVTSLATRVAEQGGEAGIFVVGADLADGHHTPHFDFDEDVIARSVLFLGASLIDRLMSSCRESDLPRDLSSTID